MFLDFKKPEKPIIGIQGGKGSFNETAFYEFVKAENIDISEWRIAYLYTTENVLKALEQGQITVAQFAVHNNLGGIVVESLNAMGKYTFAFNSSFKIKISHALMKKKSVDFAEIKVLMAHPQVLKQCEKNLQDFFPQLEQKVGQLNFLDTARIAEGLAKNEIPENIAVIGNPSLAAIYDLEIVRDNMQDSDENYTSFVWVTK